MSGRLRIDQLPAIYQNQIAAQMNAKVKVSPAFAPVSKPRIRQNSAGLNKTEQAFLDYWQATRAHGKIITQAVTLKLGNGVRYTPDFLEVLQYAKDEFGGISAYEVKGFMRDDAAVKLKVAASLYPWITFYLVTKRKGGGWDVQEVLA